MNSLPPLSRALMICGAVLFLAGVVFAFVRNLPGLGNLPGDIILRRKNFVFYFPLATSLLLSILVSLILWFINRR